jgi:hypothetical protein
MMGARTRLHPSDQTVGLLTATGHDQFLPHTFHFITYSPPYHYMLWPNIIFNKDLWKATDQEDKFRNKKKKNRWIGHTLRKEDGEIPMGAFLWNPQGRRKRLRPKNSWTRSVIKEVGGRWNELRFLAADRQKWKELHS